ncbi:MAG: hypothetical protein ACRCZJ_01640, partial [Erysipelotrichaceae bacterium]
YEEIMEFHGFYVDEAAQIINFDLIFDYRVVDPLQIKLSLEHRLTIQYPNYRFYIVLDQDFGGLEKEN